MEKKGIKIIKMGRIKKVLKFTCDSCGCIWEADEDVCKRHPNYFIKYDPEDNQSDYDLFSCECPCCGKESGLM